MLLAQKTELSGIFSSWAVGGSRIWQSWTSEITNCRSVLDPDSLWQRLQGVSSDSVKRGRAGRWEGISRRKESSVMGTTPWFSAQDILCIDIYWYMCKVVLEADWFRHNLKSLLKSSCSRSKHGASLQNPTPVLQALELALHLEKIFKLCSQVTEGELGLSIFEFCFLMWKVSYMWQVSSSYILFCVCKSASEGPCLSPDMAPVLKSGVRERLILRTENCGLLFYKSDSVYSPFLVLFNLVKQIFIRSK